MFYGKRIKELEARVDALEKKVKDLVTLVSKHTAEIDTLVDCYKELTDKMTRQQPAPKYRPKKNNGKGKPSDAE